MHNRLPQNVALKTVNFSYLTVFKGQEFRKASPGSLMRLHSNHCLGLWSLQDLSGDGRSVSEFIDMVVGMVVGYWPEALVPCHLGLCSGWLYIPKSQQPDSSRNSDPREWEPIQKPQPFTTQSRKQHTFASAVLCWPYRPILIQRLWTGIWTPGSRYHWEPSWRLLNILMYKHWPIAQVTIPLVWFWGRLFHWLF